MDMSAPADAVTQNTAAADLKKEESMSLLDSSGEIYKLLNLYNICYIMLGKLISFILTFFNHHFVSSSYILNIAFYVVSIIII